MKQPIIGFAGMTHLGINSAVATAERGFQVLCFDEDSSRMIELKNRTFSIIEPGLPELFEKNVHKISFANNKSDLLKCDIIYISTDVPTDDKGNSDLRPIYKLIEEVITCLKQDAILVILCQVPPGFTRQLNLETHRLFYQVETLIFGKAIERALYPERFMIGCFNPEIALPEVYQALLNTFQCPILPMRYESAELTKISINCCLVASISVANTLSEICEKMGADWSEIVPALKLDKRIGKDAYLNPGLGIAGGNLERDLATVVSLAESHGSDSSIVNAWIKNSRYRKDWVLNILHQKVFHLKNNPMIAIWGLSYKENTHSIKNSPSIDLINALSSYSIRVFDPVVPATVVPLTQSTSSPLEAASQADVLIIMTPWPLFRNIELKQIAQYMKGRVIIDPYRLLSCSDALKAGFLYFTLGIDQNVTTLQ